MIAKLFIDGKQADVFDDFYFNICNEIKAFNSFNDIRISNSSAEPIKLPLTDNNKQLINFSHHILSPIVLPSKASIEYNGNELLEGNIKLIEIINKYISITILLSDWITNVKELNINDLNLTDLNHIYNKANINSRTAGDVIYPLIHSGNMNYRFECDVVEAEEGGKVQINIPKEEMDKFIDTTRYDNPYEPLPIGSKKLILNKFKINNYNYYNKFADFLSSFIDDDINYCIKTNINYDGDDSGEVILFGVEVAARIPAVNVQRIIKQIFYEQGFNTDFRTDLSSYYSLPNKFYFDEAEIEQNNFEASFNQVIEYKSNKDIIFNPSSQEYKDKYKNAIFVDTSTTARREIIIPFDLTLSGTFDEQDHRHEVEQDQIIEITTSIDIQRGDKDNILNNSQYGAGINDFNYFFNSSFFLIKNNLSSNAKYFDITSGYKNVEINNVVKAISGNEIYTIIKYSAEHLFNKTNQGIYFSPDDNCEVRCTPNIDGDGDGRVFYYDNPNLSFVFITKVERRDGYYYYHTAKDVEPLLGYHKIIGFRIVIINGLRYFHYELDIPFDDTATSIDWCFAEQINFNQNSTIKGEISKDIIKDSNLQIAKYYDIKQSDFLKGIAQLFNLVFYTDTNLKRVIIDKTEDYYNDTIIDWSSKIIKDKDITIIPLAQYFSENTIFKFKEDSSDVLLERYKKKNQKDFQSYKNTFKNVFTVKGNKEEVNSCFAPLQIDYAKDISLQTYKIPKIWSESDVFYKNIPERSFEFEPRIFKYDGQKYCAEWYFEGDKKNTIDNITLLDYADLKEDYKTQLFNIEDSKFLTCFAILDEYELSRFKIEEGFKNLYKINLDDNDILCRVQKVTTDGVFSKLELITSSNQ